MWAFKKNVHTGPLHSMLLVTSGGKKNKDDGIPLQEEL